MFTVEQASTIFGRGLAEFAPDWEITHSCEVNQGNPDEWPSGLGTFGFIIRHEPSGISKILGKRKDRLSDASFHRGVSFRILEAYEGGFTEPLSRYLIEIGAVKDSSVSTTANNVFPIGPAARLFSRRKARSSVPSVRPETREIPAPSRNDGSTERNAIADKGGWSPQPVARWIQEAESVVPGVLEQYENLRSRAEAARQECERFRREVQELETENRDLRTLRDENHQVFGRLMNEMVRLVELSCQAIRERTSQLPPSLGRRLAS